MKMSRVTVFYFLLLVSLAGTLTLGLAIHLGWISSYYGSISILCGLLFAFLVFVWGKGGLKALLAVLAVWGCAVLAGYLPNNPDVLVSGLVVAGLLVPFAWTGIKFLFTAVIVGLAVCAINSAIRKINRALDLVIHNKETLERIEQRLIELNQQK